MPRSHASQDQIHAYSREAAVARWLHRRMFGEALLKIIEAVIFGGIGLVILIGIAGVVTWVLFIALLRAPVLPEYRTFGMLFLAASFFVVIIFFIFQRKGRRQDYSIGQSRPSFSAFSSTSTRFDSFADELMAGGIRLLEDAWESFSIAWRILRTNTAQTGSILLWLWKKNTKTSSDEILFRFPHLNAVRILPQLRDIPGIIWLQEPRGIFLLSGDLKAELAELFPDGGEFADSEPSDWYDQTAKPPVEATQNTEILGWYKTLELPPYVAIHDVKRRYRQLAKTYHPDALGDRSTAGTDERMTRINEAYKNILSLHKN